MGKLNKLNNAIVSELDKQFPKGKSKDRGKALVLSAIAHIELDKQREKDIEEFRKFIIEGDWFYECPEYEKGCWQCEFWKSFNKIFGDKTFGKSKYPKLTKHIKLTNNGKQKRKNKKRNKRNK